MKHKWPKWVPHGTAKSLKVHCDLFQMCIKVFPDYGGENMPRLAAMMGIEVASIMLEGVMYSSGCTGRSLTRAVRIWNKAMDMLGYTEIYDA